MLVKHLRHLISLVLLGTTTHLACNNSQTPDITIGPPPPPPYSWTTATLQDQGFNADSIALAVQAFEATQYVESFVLVRNGLLVKEAYFTLPGKYTNASIASVTKSLTSALVGIALREGYLDSVGQKLLDSFPEYVTPSLDPRKMEITLEDLLTMRSGFDYTETEDHSSIFNQNTNWMKVGIELPLRDDPGAVFNYSSIDAHLVSGMLAKGAHMSTLNLAETYLLRPLGIAALDWPKDPQGYYFGGSGVVLYPRDMARFGYLYVNGGMIGSESILPPEWVIASTEPRVNLSRSWGEFTNLQYGYYWWTAEWNTDSVFLAVGFGGQFIIGVPHRNLVIVVTSNVDCTPAQADQRHFEILNIVARDVLGALEN
jgi:CubicO group peptidase (beta-lactamase class C family)